MGGKEQRKCRTKHLPRTLPVIGVTQFAKTPPHLTDKEPFRVMLALNKVLGVVDARNVTWNFCSGKAHET